MLVAEIIIFWVTCWFTVTPNTYLKFMKREKVEKAFSGGDEEEGEGGSE